MKNFHTPDLLEEEDGEFAGEDMMYVVVIARCIIKFLQIIWIYIFIFRAIHKPRDPYLASQRTQGGGDTGSGFFWFDKNPITASRGPFVFVYNRRLLKQTIHAALQQNAVSTPLSKEI